MNCRKEDSEKEDNEKLKDKILYKQKIKGLATSIFLSLLESFSEIRNDIRYNYGNHTSDIWYLRNKYPNALQEYRYDL